MDKIEELKEIIVNLKLDLVEAEIPKGHCPYSYYEPSAGRSIDCSISCYGCRRIFMQDMERKIRKEVEAL